MLYWFQRVMRTAAFKVRSAPGVLLWSASAITWAVASRSMYAYTVGFNQGLSTADRFLERYPAVQEQFREFVNATRPKL